MPPCLANASGEAVTRYSIHNTASRLRFFGSRALILFTTSKLPNAPTVRFDCFDAGSALGVGCSRNVWRADREIDPKLLSFFARIIAYIRINALQAHPGQFSNGARTVGGVLGLAFQLESTPTAERPKFLKDDVSP